ncbi:hypothetical protein ACFLUH_02365 [Chloroflexota bacterium]
MKSHPRLTCSVHHRMGYSILLLITAISTEPGRVLLALPSGRAQVVHLPHP